MASKSLFSLIVPTRQRCPKLQSFLDSLSQTADDLERVETVLVIDADDTATRRVTHDKVRLRHVIVPPRMTMGALNLAGYHASSGRYLMLLNDDVVARTPGWDTKILACLATCPDDIVLVHVNDTLMKTNLCTFPIVSRKFCEFAGGICPAEYVRYRIDDHIEDIFNLLGVLGQQRTLYLPDVVFEHDNYVEQDNGLRQYFSDDRVLEVDAPRFEALAGQRKALALRLMAEITGEPSKAMRNHWSATLERVTDSFALRAPERLRIVEDYSEQSLAALKRRIARGLAEPPNYEYQPMPPTGVGRFRVRLQRARKHLRERGWYSLCHTIWQKAVGSRSKPDKTN